MLQYIFYAISYLFSKPCAISQIHRKAYTHLATRKENMQPFNISDPPSVSPASVPGAPKTYLTSFEDVDLFLGNRISILLEKTTALVNHLVGEVWNDERGVGETRLVEMGRFLAFVVQLFHPRLISSFRHLLRKIVVELLRLFLREMPLALSSIWAKDVNRKRKRRKTPTKLLKCVLW